MIDNIVGSTKAKGDSVAYIYFDYKDREAHTGENVIRSLLKQLLLPMTLVPQALESLYDEFCSQSIIPDTSTFMEQLISTCAHYSSVSIILDALDECGSETLDAVINLIRELSRSSVKIFVTSRPHLSNLPSELEKPLILQVEAQDDDVKNYLSVRLGKEWRYSEHLKSRIIYAIAQGTRGK